MTASTAPVVDREALPERPWWHRVLPGASVTPALRLVERNIVAWKGIWLVFVSVLLERRGKRPGQLIGKTPWLQSVHLETDAAIGDMVEVEIVSAGPNSLGGVERELLNI